ncbi:MAG TPA: DUF1573 domain-containing protein [Candidatus Hydrogenedentes bacterium]|nr:DUF1573 domain-containing protein [Candidatus Hydrogenedentota bacterium]
MVLFLPAVGVLLSVGFAYLCCAISVDKAQILTCSRPVHDAGRVRPGELIAHTFTLRNSTRSTLKLAPPTKSCGCLDATLSTMTVSPRATTELSVSLVPDEDIVGNRTEEVALRDSSGHLLACVSLRAFVMKNIVVRPSILNFGEVRFGEEKSLDCTVIDLAEGDTKLVDEHHSSDFLEVQIMNLSQFPSPAYSIKAMLSSDAPQGAFADKIIVDTANSSQVPVVIPVRGEILPPVRAVPRRLFFGRSEHEDSALQSLQLTGDGPFEIVRWTVSDPGDVSLAIDLGKHDQTYSGVFSVAGSERRDLKGELLLEVEMQDGRTATLNVPYYVYMN